MPQAPEILPWAEKLEKILKNAVAARESRDADRIVRVQRELTKFKNDSPDYADALDTQANLAIFDLDLSVTEDAVEQIKQRAQAVYAIKKIITGIAEDAESRADVLSGRFVFEAMDAAATAVESFKRLRDQLSTTKADEKAVVDEIKAAIVAVEKLRNRLVLS
jgi:hypothetical protein